MNINRGPFHFMVEVSEVYKYDLLNYSKVKLEKEIRHAYQTKYKHSYENSISVVQLYATNLTFLERLYLRLVHRFKLGYKLSDYFYVFYKKVNQK